MTGPRQLPYFLLAVQALLLLCFTGFGYPAYMRPVDEEVRKDNPDESLLGTALANVTNYYGVFMDVHVMIFIGFGYLMTFLGRHGFGSVGFNFLVAALTMQWAMVVVPVVHNIWAGNSPFDHAELNMTMLIEGDFGAAAVLITFGGLLGKIGPLQLCLVALVEIVVYAVNFNLVVPTIGALDVGGSLVIHAFGAYFGLACSYAIGRKRAFDHPKNSSTYESDLFAMVGTVFLWIYWPSFVTALVVGDRSRAALHTLLALCGSCVCGFIASMRATGKFDMVHIQNATLAGGVMIGSVADFDLGLAPALLVGSVAGAWSTVGYHVISPWLEKLGLHDTCGIHNLHGMPGLLGGMASIFGVLAGGASKLGVSEEDEHAQAAKQMFGILCTLAMALGSGYVTGLLVGEPVLDEPEEFFEDKEFWVVNEPETTTSANPVPPSKMKMGIVIAAAQALIVVVYFIAGTYGLHEPHGVYQSSSSKYYGVYMDVHVMIFVGFGYLMTFLCRHGFGSVGFNLLAAAIAVEWSMVVVPIVAALFAGTKAVAPMGFEMLIEGDFGAAAVLITFGGLLGKVDAAQLVIVALIEVVIYAVNFQLVVARVGAIDVGGSLVIHAFGAYFGLAASKVLSAKQAFGHPKNSSSYNSDLFAMVGTVFLWIYWPSFVSALVPEQRERAAIHTVLALCGSCVCAFAVSARLEGKLDMVHVQNATLAGGVAIGTVADFELGWAGALLVGCVAGAWSTVGYVFITPALERLGLHDTCGIHNLHGMPGLMGGVASIVAILAGAAENLGVSSTGSQAGTQALGLAVTLGVAIAGGTLAGYAALSYGLVLSPFEDALQWTVDAVGMAGGTAVAPSDEAPPTNAGHARPEQAEAVEKAAERAEPVASRAFVVCAALAQGGIILLYAMFGSYGDDLMEPVMDKYGVSADTENFYGVFMDVHVMIFIGFGYLMTFLYRHGFGSVGLNFFIAAIVVEWTMIVVPIMHNLFHHVRPVFQRVSFPATQMIEGDFGAAAVLITFGGLLGKISPLQLLVIGLVEIVLYAINFQIVVTEIGALDVGGSMVIHAFGAYFGLACSWVISPKESFDHKKNTSNYNSDLFAMLGTTFLWLYWPSFVTALVPEHRELGVVHTVLALCGSCACAFAASVLAEGRFDMVHIQNATLAGGVAIGAVADFDLGPGGALLVGMAAGIVSTFGYVRITPALERLGVHDTCGVHNLHGMPGLLGGVASVVGVATGCASGLGVSKADAVKQVTALLTVLGMAIGGGAATGWLAKRVCSPLEALFDDEVVWTLEEDGEEQKPAAEQNGKRPSWTDPIVPVHSDLVVHTDPVVPMSPLTSPRSDTADAAASA